MAAGLVGPDGELSHSRQVPTPKTGDAESLFDCLASLMGEVRDEATSSDGLEPEACGVGCGGPMERDGETVSPLNIPAWRGFALRRRIAEATGLPVCVDNDAKALALAEGWRGAARGRRSYVAMVVSTGIGGGIVLDGRLLEGCSGNAGHIGHVIVEPGGRMCRCGARGCVEAEASGTAIEEITGRPAYAAEAEMVERSGTLVGRAVASAVSLLDLELAVVAGSVALGFGEPFFRAAQAELARRSRLEFTRGARIIPAGLAGAGPLVGAGALAWQMLGMKVLS